MSRDGSVIDLSVSMFDWAKFRRTKGAIKLHLLLDHDGYLPSFAVVTEGQTSEIKVARTLRFAPGTILAVDRGYIDYEWFRELTQEEVYFVTRMKENAVYEVKEELEIPQNSNVVRDQIICFPRLAREGEDPVLFRRVEILDEEKQETIVFLSNLLAFGATTIAAIYKDRWQVEASKARCKPEQLLCADAGFIAGADRCVHDDCRHAGAEGDGVRPRAAEHQPGVADCGAADGKAAGWPDGATGQDGRATDGCRAERDSGHPRGGDVEGRADAWGRRRSEVVCILAGVCGALCEERSGARVFRDSE